MTIINAYDIEVLDRGAERGHADCHGWCFGLPPGIRREQWPLDRISGYPLVHGFTIRLPEDYRCHGPDIIALSFFATPCDQNLDARVRSELHDAVIGNGSAPTDADLLPFWQGAHPRLHRMRDIVDNEYAVILLAEEEFAGPPCEPPRQADNRFLRPKDRPQWLSVGAGYAYADY